MSQNILEVKDLKVSFRTYVGEVQAVRGVSFELKKEKCWRLLVNPAAENLLLRKRS